MKSNIFGSPPLASNVVSSESLKSNWFSHNWEIEKRKKGFINDLEGEKTKIYRGNRFRRAKSKRIKLLNDFWNYLQDLVKQNSK
jgi:hypothetical protein